MSSIDLSNTGLITLKGQDIPEVIDGSFNCTDNKLTSLEFGPEEVTWNCFCSYNILTSLEFCPSRIGDSLYVNSNLITNLKDIHKQFKNGYIGDHLSLFSNPIKSHELGVILIPGLQNVFMDITNKQSIFNKHLKSGRDVLECQEELIQNGFKEFAQL